MDGDLSVSEGDVVTVKILRIEPERRRLGLSLRQAEGEDLPMKEIQTPSEEALANS